MTGVISRRPTPPTFPEVAPFPLFLAGKFIPLLGALYLMNGRVPPAILSAQLLGIRPTTPSTISLIQFMGWMGRSRPMEVLRFIMGFASGKVSRMQDAIEFANVTLSHLGRAIAGNQQVGFELEFDPNLMSRDATHLMMAKALRGAGYPVEIQYGAQTFVFQRPLKVAPLIVGQAMIKGQPVRSEIFRSNGTTLVSVARNADTAKTHVLATSQTASLAEADGILQTMLDTPPRETYIVIAKDDTGDTLKLRVDITGRTGARLTGLNGKFRDSTGQLHDSIDIDVGRHLPKSNGGRPQLEAILAHLTHALPNDMPIQKTNPITGLQVSGLGNGAFQVVDEIPPFLEAISAKMNVGEVDRTKPMIAAFRDSGFDGTRAAKMVGMHVHAEVGYQVNDRISIAPALNVLRAFAASQHMIYDLFPSHHNRGGFIQRMPDAYQKLLAAPDYVTDPADPVQIARVIADYNTHTPVKYSDLNMDNLFAVMVHRMGLDPALARTAPLKPTAELRLFDSIMDPDSVAFIAQFWGAFVYKYGNNQAN